MTWIHLAGQMLFILETVSELAPFKISEMQNREVDSAVSLGVCPSIPTKSSELIPQVLISRASGWVGDAERSVEIWSASRGFLLRVNGGSDFFISNDGQIVQSVNHEQSDGPLNKLDRQILLGPVLVFALALRGVWSLHASAVMYGEHTIAFLGESGDGKSTLAGYLSQNTSWDLVADDILPVRIMANDVQILPRFPQLKLAPNAQPGTGLGESLSLKNIFVLKQAEVRESPALQALTSAQSAQALLSHIAGARMFDSNLLAKHLQFCAQAAPQISFYELSYPHRRDALPTIQEMLKTLLR